MEMLQRMMTQWTNELGLSLEKVRNLKIEGLKRIPEPPEIYRKWRCLIRGDEDKSEQLGKAMRTLERQYKDDDPINKVEQYEKGLRSILDHNLKWAELALAADQVEFKEEGMAPIEKIEIREADWKKHGNTQWMLIFGFEFWMDDEKMKRRKIYIPLDPQNPKFDMLRFLKRQEKGKNNLDQKMAATGEGIEERQYPIEWDQLEVTDDF